VWYARSSENQEKESGRIVGLYRRPLFCRIGLMAFAGVGSVAKSSGGFNAGTLLRAAGVGVRFVASKKYDVNVSAALAVGRDLKALYFYIGEAFWPSFAVESIHRRLVNGVPHCAYRI
jgi:hypothetical protein